MSLGPLLFSVEFPLLAISTIFVAARFYCRTVIIHSLGSDDWIMLVALVHSWGLGILNVFQIDFGTGHRSSDLALMPTSQYNRLYVATLKVWFLYNITYIATLFYVKSSILAFYRRLSPAQGYQMALKITGALVAFYTVGMILVNVFECPRNPTQRWSLSYPQGCIDLVPALYVQAALNIVSDIAILLLPIPSLVRLKVNRAKKIALILIFSTGSVAVVASIVRIKALNIFQHTSDVAYDGALILLWSSVEINVAIISASAPSLQPLVRNIMDGSSKKTIYNRRPSQAVGNAIPLESYSGPGRDARITTNVTGRGESQESIVMKSGIMRTTDVSVEIAGDGRSDVDVEG